jgi:FkbM family methyltransferase
VIKSYAQAGQDAYINFLLLRQKFIPREPDYMGFYVDVGCAQPVTSSNTFSFYERNWHGLCIDANPDNKGAFVEKRPRDIYVTSGISNEAGNLPFHVFSNPQHNTFDGSRMSKGTYLKTIDVPIRPLKDVLGEALPEGQTIDFMSIDVENYELKAVQGMDFTIHRPKIVVLEALSPLASIADHPVTRHMKGAGYALIAHTGHDSFFALKRA